MTRRLTTIEEASQPRRSAQLRACRLHERRDRNRRQEPAAAGAGGVHARRLKQDADTLNELRMAAEVWADGKPEGRGPLGRSEWWQKSSCPAEVWAGPCEPNARSLENMMKACG